MDDTTRAQLRETVARQVADAADIGWEQARLEEDEPWLTQRIALMTDAIMAAFETATAMRPITPETMPPEGIDVVACDDGGCSWWIAFWETDNHGLPWWQETHENMTIEPEYWCPKPRLPKERQ